MIQPHCTNCGLPCDVADVNWGFNGRRDAIGPGSACCEAEVIQRPPDDPECPLCGDDGADCPLCQFAETMFGGSE